MSWRRIITYYLLFAFLGGYYFLFETQPQREVEAPRAAPVQPAGQMRPFLNLTQESIQELVVRRLDGEVVCRREGDSWQVVEPASVRRVPSSLITSLVENLVQSREAEVMAEAPADLSPFGLDMPRSTLVLKTNNQNASVTVFLGDRNPPATAVYARLEGSPQVFLLGLTVKYYEELLFESAGAGKKG
jgi:hypothetical protein